MQKLINYYSQLLNIKKENEFVVADMTDKLNAINAINKQGEFRSYVASKLNDFDFKYNTGFQKFILLADKFLKEQNRIINADRLTKADKTAQVLSDKIKAIREEIKEQNMIDPRFVKTKNGNYFTRFEIKQIDKIGNLIVCANLQTQISGRDMLLEKLEQLMEDIVLNDKKQLISESKNVKKLINNTFRSISK